MHTIVQGQQTSGVTVLQIHPGSLASSGLLHVGDIIDKVPNIVIVAFLIVIATDQ